MIKTLKIDSTPEGIRVAMIIARQTHVRFERHKIIFDIGRNHARNEKVGQLHLCKAGLLKACDAGHEDHHGPPYRHTHEGEAASIF